MTKCSLCDKPAVCQIAVHRRQGRKVARLVYEARCEEHGRREYD